MLNKFYYHYSPRCAKYHLLLYHILGLVRDMLMYSKKHDMNDEEDTLYIKDKMLDVILTVDAILNIEGEYND